VSTAAFLCDGVSVHITQFETHATQCKQHQQQHKQHRQQCNSSSIGRLLGQIVAKNQQPTDARTRTCSLARWLAGSQAYTHARRHARTRTLALALVKARTQDRTHARMHADTLAHTHTHTDTHTHTQAHARPHMHNPRPACNFIPPSLDLPLFIPLPRNPVPPRQQNTTLPPHDTRRPTTPLPPPQDPVSQLHFICCVHTPGFLWFGTLAFAWLFLDDCQLVDVDCCLRKFSAVM